jgi:hypothetical protein
VAGKASGNSAVEFVLSTCLPAMDDVTNVEANGAGEKIGPSFPPWGTAQKDTRTFKMAGKRLSGGHLDLQREE